MALCEVYNNLSIIESISEKSLKELDKLEKDGLDFSTMEKVIFAMSLMQKINTDCKEFRKEGEDKNA